MAQQPDSMTGDLRPDELGSLARADKATFTAFTPNDASYKYAVGGTLDVQPAPTVVEGTVTETPSAPVKENSKYIIGDATYEFPSSMTEDEVMGVLRKHGLLPSRGTQDKQKGLTFAPAPDDIDPDTLHKSKDWLKAARNVYKMQEGKDFTGDNKDLAEYGLDAMGWFNYNLPVMGVDAARVNKATDDEKQSFLYLMDTYDKTNISWKGAGRFFKGVLTDPTTYVGLGTLGLGMAGREGAKTAAKQGVRELLKQGTRTGVVAGVEGGIYATADNVMRQSVEVSAGRKQEINTGEALTSTAIGVGLGFAGGTALDALASKVRNMFSTKPDATPAPANTTELVTQDTPAAQSKPDVPGEPQKQLELGLSQPSGNKVIPDSRAPAPLSEIIDRTLKPNTSVTPDDPIMGELIDHVKLEDLSLPKSDLTIPYEKQKISANVSKAMSLAREFQNLDHAQVDDIVGQLRAYKFSMDEMEQFALSSNLATEMVAKELAATFSVMQKTKDKDTFVEMLGKSDELNRLFSKLSSMSEAIKSHQGYALRQTQATLNTKKLPSPDDPQAFAEAVFKAGQEKETKAFGQDFDRRITLALDENDVAKAGRLAAEKQLAMDNMLDKHTEGIVNRSIRKFNELAISFVFSPITIMRNVVPTAAKMAYRPALNAMLSNPFEAATRREMTATYSAMASSMKAARSAARAAFKYEQAILTRGDAKYLESSHLAIKGKKGGYIRLVPRIVNATDEFMSHMVYQGYISGTKAAEAYEDAVARGLKGKELDAYVDGEIKTAVEQSYSPPTGEGGIRALMTKATNLYSKPDDILNYVEKELAQNSDSLKYGNHKEAIEYVETMLYKKRFSERGTTSKLAAKYESAVNAAPVLRLVGQLFFRTPVRVFEEGIRMTPGVQIIAPHFMSDLAGKNGQRAQLRAQGEALISLAFTGSILSLYAQGKITGDGAYSSWKQEKHRKDSDMPEPYTITLDDGSTWNFKMFDPIGTPMKIIVNALERYEDLTMRKQQGELIDKTELEQAFAAISVGTGAISQAIRDASLVSGIEGMAKLYENLSDPEENETAGLKFLGEKLRFLTPNTLQKIALTNDPTLDDPATFWQMIESRLLTPATLGAYDKTVPKSYDLLGNERKMADTGALFNVFSTASIEERKQGKSEKDLEVLRGLSWLEKQTNTTLSIPKKHPSLGGIDLRTVYTKDGEETLFDRWNRYYRDMPVEDVLQPLLKSGLPVGTKSINGAMAQTAAKTLRDFREAAFAKVQAEEAGLIERGIKRSVHKAEVQAGLWDTPR